MPPVLLYRSLRRLLQPMAGSLSKSRSRIIPAMRFTTGEPYWRKVGRWQEVNTHEFISQQWQAANTVKKSNIVRFLEEVLPNELARSKDPRMLHIQSRENFIEEAIGAIREVSMNVSITPHLLSLIDWASPLDDPIRLQFLPLRSDLVNDHSSTKFDSLCEIKDSRVTGLVHRYPDKALFLANSICPVYCRFCTRSYVIGGSTETVFKEGLRGGRRRWSSMFQYLREHSEIQDVVISGGDAYMLQPEHVSEIGETILNIPHIRRIRFASKGLCVAPGRIIDRTDPWTERLLRVARKGRQLHKHVCLHTHFSHPNEITWITRAAANYLQEEGLTVRNQTVLLRRINDNVETMGTLIRRLADMNIIPYYVYQCDMVKNIEDMRTPLSTILDMEQRLRGTIAGFMMPNFVVDLPGGGGKRLACTAEYDRAAGIARFRTSPGMGHEKADKVYEYHDPRT